jgi:hypothetical protein
MLMDSQQLPTSLGQKAMANSLAVALSNDQLVIPVGSTAVEQTFNPTINAGAYGAGNNVGGLLTLTNFLRVGGPFSGLLQSLVVVEVGTQKAPIDVLIFRSLPAGTFTDHAAFPTLSAADAALIIQRIPVAAADYVTVGGVSVARAVLNIPPGLKGAAATLYAAVNTSGTPTFASTTALTFRFYGLQD